MSTRRPRERERGAITPAIAVATLLASVLSIGGITIGQLAVKRGEAQRAADAGTLAALQVIKERGLPFDANKRAAAEAIARGNSGRDIRFAWSVTDCRSVFRAMSPSSRS